MKEKFNIFLSPHIFMNNTIFVDLSGNPGFIRLEIKLLQLLLTLGYVRQRFQNLDNIVYYKKNIKLTICECVIYKTI